MTRDTEPCGPLKSAIQAALTHAGLTTQEQAAQALGVSQGLISHYLTGRHAPDPERLAAIAAATGCDLIITIEGNWIARPRRPKKN